MIDIKKSQERKDKILANLTGWCLDPMGNLVNANDFKDRNYKDFNTYWFRLYQNDKTNPNWRTEPKTDDNFIFTIEDYQEIKEALIKEIKTSPLDWKIEKDGNLTVIRHKSGRKHWYSEYQRTTSEDSYVGFKEEEWQVIKSTLGGQENNEHDDYNNLTREELINEIKQLKEELQKVNSSQNTINSPKPDSVLPIAISVISIVGLFGGLIIWKRNKRDNIGRRSRSR